MKKLLFALLLLLVIVPGANQVFAYEGCMTFRQYLQGQGVIVPGKDGIFDYTCKGNANVNWYYQCLEYCDTLSGLMKDGCRAGCGQFSHLLGRN